VTHHTLRGVVVGAGYFSSFHFDAWRRTPGIEIVGVCDFDVTKAQAAARNFGIPRVYSDSDAMLDAERPDFIDIVTPPASHRTLCALAGRYGVHVLCQKALAPTLDEAVALVAEAEQSGIRLMVHDNFRFQPWHREIRRLIDAGAIGTLQAISVRTRMGDGWTDDAYLSRQPYFRTMPQLLVFETGVHFIDVFRYLSNAEVRRVFATLRQRNRAIVGEDAGIVVCEFDDDTTALWDASRYHQSLTSDPRYTFGEFLIEGEGGALRLAEDGTLIIHRLGQSPAEHPYVHTREGFAGDCCHAAIEHFISHLRDHRPFETEGRAYLNTLLAQEAAYRAAASGRAVEVADVAASLEV
jgi:predicted dehydrogenase